MSSRDRRGPAPSVIIRRTRPADFDAIVAISRRIYPRDRWRRDELASHLEIFPEGQLVAVGDDRVLGMAASLVLSWDDYDYDESWHDYTGEAMFVTHDPSGRTLYGAEVMVDPDARRMGVGSALYAARRELVRDLGLWRIRAHSRLAGYHRHAADMDAHEYVRRVIRGQLDDPPLSFQLAWGFRVLAVVSGYLADDPQSLGKAALIEWLDEETAPPEASAGRRADFAAS